MADTKSSSGGFRRITRLNQPVKVRLLGFVAVVVGGTVLLSWITYSTWQQLDSLEKEYATVRSESFYVGVTMRGEMRSLNDKILQFGLTHDPETRNAFLEESGELQSLIRTNRVELDRLAKLRLLSALDMLNQEAILQRAEREYGKYLTNAASLLSPNGPSARTQVSFERLYNRIRDSSADVIALCNDLVRAQREAFGEFLTQTQGTLASHHRLLRISMALTIALAAGLAWLVYRGLIAPLRLGLSESKTIIERQEKLASLGILASGVAHEVRNPLTAIKIRLFTLRKSFPALAQNEDATTIADEITRLERIVRDFLNFARPSEPELARVSCSQIVHDVSGLMKAQLERMAIHLNVEENGTAWVHADVQQMKQVLINLIQNAAESIGRNGKITLAVKRETTELEGRQKPSAIFVVTDTGKGIPPEVESRLFDPFFTTKQGGAGLGLAISARIVEKHGGVLRYETEVNRGTSFEIVLPRIEIDATENIDH
jgi:signal transduction histidine kinase